MHITQGHEDITPMFESYHAFTDIERLRKDLSAYQVGKSEYPQKYTFEKGDFYDTIRTRIRAYFGSAKNVNDKVKINNFWIIKSIILSLCYVFNLYMAFFNSEISDF